MAYLIFWCERWIRSFNIGEAPDNIEHSFYKRKIAFSIGDVGFIFSFLCMLFLYCIADVLDT